jgi:hypothetical protein
MIAARRLSLQHALAMAVLVIALQALVLWLLGRVPICTCGYVKLWEGDVLSSGNSQHIADWYSFTHIVHGFVFYFLLRVIRPRWSVPARLVAAVLVEAGWEMLENTDFVINAYRADTISLNYYGDSIVNSVSDTLFAVIGFGLARVLPAWTTVTCAVGLELYLGWAIHDNLTLNVLMLIHPIPLVKAWQLQGQVR